MFPAGKNVRGSLKNIAENAGEVSFMCEPCFKNKEKNDFLTLLGVKHFADFPF